MSEMIERVARAIERERWVIAMEQATGRTVDSMEGSRRTSRAAIEAMREPNAGMLDAGRAADDGCHADESPPTAEGIANIFRDMIDAALEAK